MTDPQAPPSTASHPFSPRPEAHAMRWATLLDPVRKAVHDLLLRIDGAETARLAQPGPDAPHQRPELGSCFLVYGSRGTGKTTVLLSAQQAVQGTGAGAGFFDPDPGGATAIDRNTESGDGLPAAQDIAKRLRERRHIVWLDPLDLEPLPRKTNLLTTLLTRVRNALDAGDGSHDIARERMRSTSIFEETGDDPRQLLEHLINDATLMWEEIQEPDTRNKAQRQRAAADIYARFRQMFLTAMDALSRRLALRHGHDEGCSILLPIDNIDRSTEHLKAIVKLAQMVSHPCLWLVMAGDRVEVETFLERAYWTELILSQEGADARGKAGESGEDETLGMARRQGHATAQKVWPPSHRIEVDFVEPAETLAFFPPGWDQTSSLRALLSKVPVWCSMHQQAFGRPLNDLTDPYHAFMLIRLFEREAGSAEAAAPEQRLTRAGELALRLPARSVLDLWQLAAGMADKPRKRFGAVKIVRTMLRSTAAGSALPSRMIQHLQTEILSRDPRGGTLLTFDQVRLQVRGRLSIATAIGLIDDPLYVAAVPDALPIRSALRARRSADMRVSLTLDGPDGAVTLPDLAAAWLAILYDILIFEPTLAVLGMVKIDIPLVLASHDLVLPDQGLQRLHRLEVPWRAPNFCTFHAHDAFWRQWEHYLQRVAPACRTDSQATLSATQLALGWVNTALQTFIDTSPYPDDVARDHPRNPTPQQVLDLAAALYAKYQPETIQPLLERRSFDSVDLCHWLENALPMLFSQLYAPSGARTDCHLALQTWIAANAAHQLVTHWRKNRAFLLAAVDLPLDEIKPADSRPADARPRRAKPGKPGKPARRDAGAQTLPPETRRALALWARGGLAEVLGSADPAQPRGTA